EGWRISGDQGRRRDRLSPRRRAGSARSDIAPDFFRRGPCRRRPYSFVSLKGRDEVMLYAILCYDSEEVVGAWTKEEDDAAMTKLSAVQKELAEKGRLGPVARLLPTTAATTVRKGREQLVID